MEKSLTLSSAARKITGLTVTLNLAYVALHRLPSAYLAGILFHLGELAPARALLEQGMALYNPMQHSTLAVLYGQDPGVVCRSYAARPLWLLGYPDQALQWGREALALAQEAYEAAVAERERWLNGGQVAIPVEVEQPARGLDAVVGQELAWRAVKHQDDEPRGLLGRLKKRIRG